MIEGLVMEIHKNYIIVLTHGGEFLKLRKKGTVSVGDIYKGNIYRAFSSYYAAAAAVLFIITTFGGYTAYARQIVGIVDISGSKNIKLYVNRSGKIQKVEGLSDSSNLKNSTVDNALNEINKIAIKEGLFEKDEEVTVETKALRPSKVNLDEVKNKLQSVVNNKDTKQDLKDNSKDVPNDNKNTKPEKKNDKNNEKGQSDKDSKNKEVQAKPSTKSENGGKLQDSGNKNMNEKKNDKEKDKDKSNKGNKK